MGKTTALAVILFFTGAACETLVSPASFFNLFFHNDWLTLASHARQKCRNGGAGEIVAVGKGLELDRGRTYRCPISARSALTGTN